MSNTTKKRPETAATAQDAQRKVVHTKDTIPEGLRQALWEISNSLCEKVLLPLEWIKVVLGDQASEFFDYDPDEKEGLRGVEAARSRNDLVYDLVTRALTALAELGTRLEQLQKGEAK